MFIQQQYANSSNDNSVYDGALQRRELLNYESHRQSLTNINHRGDNDIISTINIKEHSACQIMTSQYMLQQQNTNNQRLNNRDEILLTFQNNLNNNNRSSFEEEEFPEKLVNIKKQRKNNIWKKSALVILIFISKFIQIIKTYGSGSKFKQIDKNIFSILGDKAAFYSVYQLRNFFLQDQANPCSRFLSNYNQLVQQYILNKICFGQISVVYTWIMKYIQIIHPNCVIKIIWDVFVLVILLINLFYVPLKITFIDTSNDTHHNLYLEDYQKIILNESPGWILLVDIALTFNTACYDKGELIFNRRLIAKSYFNSSFIFDFLASFIFFISRKINIPYLDIILFLRFNKVIKIEKLFAEQMNLRETSAAIYDLFKLIFFILATAHICCCVFIFISEIEQNVNDNPNVINNIYKFAENQDWYCLYINGLYWAMITMLTVGYGDIVPTSNTQKIFVIFFALLGCGMFAYAVNSIGMIIQDISKRNNEFKTKISILSSHMIKRGLNSQLQTKVKKYFEYLDQEKQQDNEEAESMLQQLTASLKKEVLTDIYLKILRQKKIFYLNFSSKFLEELAPRLKEKRIMPEEFIFKTNQSIDKIFILMNGSAQIYVQQGEQMLPIQKIGKGGIIGHRQFFSGSITNFGVKTINIVSLIYIQHKDFLDVIKNFPEDFEKFCMMRDNINFNSNTKGIGLQCMSCGKYTHAFQNCPFINYIPNRDRIIQRINNNYQQKRKQYERSRRRTQTPTQFVDLLKDQLIEFLHDNNMIENLQFLLDQKEQNQLEQQQMCDDNKQEEKIENIFTTSALANIRKTGKRTSILYGGSDSRQSSQKPIQDIQEKDLLQQQLQDEKKYSLIIDKGALCEEIKNNETNINKHQEEKFNMKSSIEIFGYDNDRSNKEISTPKIRDSMEKKKGELSNSQQNSDNTSPQKSQKSIQFSNVNSFTQLDLNQNGKPILRKQLTNNSHNSKIQSQSKNSGLIIQQPEINRNTMFLSQLVNQVVNFDIDQVCSFEIFFPQYNITNILKEKQQLIFGQIDSITKKKKRLEELYQNALQSRKSKSRKTIQNTIYQHVDQNNNEYPLQQQSEFRNSPQQIIKLQKINQEINE